MGRKNERTTDERILAVDLMPRGFGYVVVEPPGTLVDWGLADARADVDRHCLRRLAVLVRRYRPDVLLLEDHRHRGCRRRDRVRGLLARLDEVATARNVRVVRIPASTVRATFGALGVSGKHGIAVAIAGRHPELKRRLPPPRKLWTSEDKRFGIFDAAALCHTYLKGRSGQTGGRRHA